MTLLLQLWVLFLKGETLTEIFDSLQMKEKSILQVGLQTRSYRDPQIRSFLQDHTGQIIPLDLFNSFAISTYADCVNFTFLSP